MTMKPDRALVDALEADRYTDVRLLGDAVCAVQDQLLTSAIVVGLDHFGYQRRYCYEHRDDAQRALAMWDGAGHPPGPWIKCKGAGIDLLNPELA